MPIEPGVFTSWKEIASYLGKGVRTVQRWEAQFGLPVQRPNIRCKGIVRATRDDLDRWVSTRWSVRQAKAPAVSDELEVLRRKVTELTTENAVLRQELEARRRGNSFCAQSSIQDTSQQQKSV
ncbi:MAG TPA: hypothetical protein VF135_07010 [Terriglobales bacterium]